MSKCFGASSTAFRKLSLMRPTYFMASLMPPDMAAEP